MNRAERVQLLPSLRGDHVCIQCDYIIGDNPDASQDWEWIGEDGLTDSQREELTRSFYEGKIFPDPPDKEMTSALR
jgi:hypothetical protein